MSARGVHVFGQRTPANPLMQLRMLQGTSQFWSCVIRSHFFTKACWMRSASFVPWTSFYNEKQISSRGYMQVYNPS
jgi:hypothetical protein